MMLNLRTRVKQEWQALDSLYPEWLTRIVLDDANYMVVVYEHAGR